MRINKLSILNNYNMLKTDARYMFYVGNGIPDELIELEKSGVEITLIRFKV